MRYLLIVALVGCSSSEPSPTPAATDREDEGKPVAPEPRATKASSVPKKPPAAPTMAPAVDEATTARFLAELATAAGCEDDETRKRPWCIAAAGWAKGTAEPLPSGTTVLVGLNIELSQNRPASKSLSENLSLIALTLRSDGDQTSFGRALLVISTHADSTIASIYDVFNGKAKSPAISPKLSDFFDPTKAEARYSISKDELGWTWSGSADSELRRVDDHWVLIEKQTWGSPTINVAVFTDP